MHRSRRLAAIMFTDIVGYSALTQADEAAALAVLQRHNRLLRPIFPRFRGREVKTVGDAFLVEFPSALDAVRCAVRVQEALREYNSGSPGEWKLRVRVGIHVGDVVETDDDVLGDAVNLASRIEALADPGGICLSQQVYDQVHNKVSFGLERRPPTTVKNFREPVIVYRVVGPEEGAPGAVRNAPKGAARQLAVLPLANISPDAKDAYFADGLTEELISALSQVRGLSVIARTSVEAYKTAPKSIAQVGSELGVDSVLEGSVRRAGNRIRISLQLIDAATQSHVWTSTYNREVDDIFAVQMEVAERAARALQLELTPKSAPAAGSEPKPSPVDARARGPAYDAYLRGLVASSNVMTAGPDEAVRCFEEATRLDPTFADAYASWAEVYVMAAGDSVPMRKVMPRARELAARALALDPSSSSAHAALGNIALQFDNDWPTAEAEFLKALELNPSNLNAHRFLGMLYVSLERFDEAEAEFRRMIQLDPAGHHRGGLAWAQLQRGDTERGLRTLREGPPPEPTDPRHQTFGFLYLDAGRRADALKEAAFPFDPHDENARFDHAILNAMLGKPAEARRVLAEAARGRWPGHLARTFLAMLHTTLGEKSRALDLLEADHRDGERLLWLFYRSAAFDGLRDEPRFLALLREVGVPVDTIARRPAVLPAAQPAKPKPGGTTRRRARAGAARRVRRSSTRGRRRRAK